MTNRSACHVSSIAQLLLSTSPASRPVRCTESKVRSVSTPDAFFGQAIQSPPAGASRLASGVNARVSSP